MSDWYTQASEALVAELSEVLAETKTPEDSARAAISFLSEIGLIDYDVEKEILHERYIEENDDD